MPTMYDADDIVDMKNRKKRLKRLRKLLIFLLIAAIGAALYITRDKWYNKLRGIGKQYRTIVNSGQLAEGNFPIDVNGGEDYQVDLSEDTLVILSDTYTYYYDTDGSLLKKRQHTYTNPVMRSKGDCVLVYENGGEDLSLEDSDSVIYSKTFDSGILFARVSREGYVGVVTKSANYSCEVHIYDKKGKSIYDRKCIEMVSDLSFTDSSKGCVLSYITAENGRLVTKVSKIVFTESGELWNSPGINTLGLEVYGFSNGAFVLGMEACGYVDGNGQISSYYEYDGDLAAGASSGGMSAVAINNDDRRKYVLALFKSGGSEPLIVDLEAPSVDVIVFDELAYVLCQGKILAYDFSGGLRSTADVNDSYTGFERSGDHIFLKGYNKVDRIDYQS